MRIIFEGEEVYSDKFNKIFESTMNAYRVALEEDDPTAQIMSINLYITTRDTSGNIIDGLERTGNTWLIKDHNFKEEEVTRVGMKINTFDLAAEVKEGDEPTVNIYKLVNSRPKPAPASTKISPYSNKR